MSSRKVCPRFTALVVNAIACRHVVYVYCIVSRRDFLTIFIYSIHRCFDFYNDSFDVDFSDYGLVELDNRNFCTAEKRILSYLSETIEYILS